MFSDEEGQLRKFRRSAAALAYSGAVVLVASAWTAWALGGWNSLWIALAAAAGGLLLGSSLLFDVSRQQWPVIKPLIDRAALERAARAAPPVERGDTD
jgi:hypothetical protein